MKVFVGLVVSAVASPVPVIIGGKNASDGQFPHQVTLKKASGSHYCGGSIINTNKVSTPITDMIYTVWCVHCFYFVRLCAQLIANNFPTHGLLVLVLSISTDKDKTRVVPLNCSIQNTVRARLTTTT